MSDDTSDSAENAADRKKLMRARWAVATIPPIRVRGVLVVEDGPTLTHGEMKYGAGTVAAQKWGASEIIDPRPWAKGELAETFQKYPDIGVVLPAMGYGDKQMKDLEETINAVDCDVVVIGTPIDLGRLLTLNKPAVRVRYDLAAATVELLKGEIERLLA